MDDEVPDSSHLPRSRREIWLLLGALLLIPLAFLIPVGAAEKAIVGLDPTKLHIGLGIFLCICLLWMTEALPLAA